MIMTWQEAQRSTQARCITSEVALDQNGFDAVAVDTRSINLPNTLFIPLRGQSQDGHSYLTSAIEKGATGLIVDTAFTHTEAFKQFQQELTKKPLVCLVVENTLTALHDLARSYIRNFAGVVKIGITGSSGKTTVKEMLARIFAVAQKKVFWSAGNLNSETGMPLSIFNLTGGFEYAIFEMGMNHRGEMAQLARILEPDIAVITTIGTAHIGNLGSQAAIAQEKFEIFRHSPQGICGYIPSQPDTRALQKTVHGGQVHVYDSGQFRLSSEKTVVLESIEDRGFLGSTIFLCETDRGKKTVYPISLALPGRYNVSNALAAITVALAQKVSLSAIKQGLETVELPHYRSKIVHASVTFLLDCYNANPESMRAALLFFTEHMGEDSHIVLADMKELGEKTAYSHQMITDLVAEHAPRRVYLVGDAMYTAGMHTKWHKNTTVAYFRSDALPDLCECLDRNLHAGAAVFVKGSRSMALECVEPVLRKKR